MTIKPDTASIVRQLNQRNLTIATAESLTAGMLSSTLAEVPGASATLRGGVVAYSNMSKHKVLNVPADILATNGAVDAQTAKYMASGVRELFQTDLGIATTGVAGPDQSEGKAVGIVFVALASSHSAQVKLFRFEGDRQNIREQTVARSLQFVEEWLNV